MAGEGSSGGGTGSGGGAGSLIKVGLVIGSLIFGGAVAWTIFGPKDDKPKPTVVATSVPQPSVVGDASPSSRPTSNPPPNPNPSALDKEGLRASYPDSVVLTITTYGLPARVSAQEATDGDVYSRGVVDPATGPDSACYPDSQYPNPCVSYWIVRKGTVMTVTAGDSRAGFWPGLDSVHGPGCELGRTKGVDLTCNLTMGADVDLVATYYGSDTASGEYRYPKCPATAGQGLTNPPAWIARCR